MTQKIRALLRKYREELLYLVFGGLTTAVDFAVSYFLYFLALNVHLADGIAWVAAVLFAYATNRKWVFESDKHTPWAIFCELVSFAGGRLLTLGMQEALVFLFYDCLHWNKYVVRIPVAVLVVVANYFISKLVIFRKRRKNGSAEQQEK